MQVRLNSLPSTTPPAKAVLGKPFSLPKSLRPDGDHRCLLVKEVAEALNVSAQFIINAIECGELQAINLAGRGSTHNDWRIPVECWEAYIRDHFHKG